MCIPFLSGGAQTFWILAAKANGLGLLCLGTKETIEFSEVADCFEPVARPEWIYRKVA